VKACHLEDLLNAESRLELKIASRLNNNVLAPKGRSSSMKVGNSRAVLNRTATGLRVLAFTTQDSCYITTSWFVNHINRWFDLMSSGSHNVALSKRDEKQYQEALQPLRKTIHLFANMKVGHNGHFKPVQKGVIMATLSILHVQDVLLNQRVFRFVLTGRFTQDFLENLFSSIRARQSTPHALMFKNFLKVVTIAQYSRVCKGSSYILNEGRFLLDFPDYVKKREAEGEKTAAQVQEMARSIPRATARDIDQLSLWERYVIYDLAGAVLAGVRKIMIGTSEPK